VNKIIERKIIMKKILLAGYCISLMGFICITSAYAADIKIGVIDTERILAESRAARETQALFAKEIEENRNLLLGKQKEVEALQEELNTQRLDMTPAVLSEKQDKLSRVVKEYNRMKNDIEEDLKNRDNELSRGLLTDIREIVSKYSKEEKFTLILEKNSVVTFDDAIDITNKIIQLYDAAQ
jgi:outer membrane protein